MIDWQKIILKETDVMRSAIEILNSQAHGIVVVVGPNGSILGTITDGDVRRALLQHYEMDCCLKEIMHTKPIVADMSSSKERIFSIMRKHKLLQIPIVDGQNKVVGLETVTDLLSIGAQDHPVIIMAGGFGTRLKSLTQNTPKPMLKVGDRPILQIIFEQFVDSGFHNFFFSTHFKSELIRDHFGDGRKWNVSINYIHEKKPLGTAGVLGLLPRDLPDLPIILINGDVLTKIDFRQLLSFHEKQGGDATACVRDYEVRIPYGIAKTRDHELVQIIEKPVQKFFINAGVYVLNHSILQNIKKGVPLDMPDLIQSKLEKGKKINIFPLHEYWLDIGEREQYQKAQDDVEIF